tara:strand:+ start:789 stop:1277 length:489 start_codon:yes stop_codon:yes gene_type:complete
MSNEQYNLFGFNPDQVGGKVGADHPETSQVAARNVKSGGQKAQAIKALAREPKRGMTAYELSEHIVNGAGRTISPNQAGTRLGELRDQGLAVYLYDEVGRAVERETTPGNTGIVNVLTRQGFMVATNIHIEETEFQSEETRQYLLEAGLRGGAGDRKWKSSN